MLVYFAFRLYYEVGEKRMITINDILKENGPKIERPTCPPKMAFLLVNVCMYVRPVL